MTQIRSITDDDFQAVVLDADRPVLVDFWAPWCGPCLQMAPILRHIATEHAEHLTVVAMNVDENPHVPAVYRVTGLPTLNLYIDGEVATTVRGAKPKAALLRDLQPFIGADRGAGSITL